MGNVRSSKEIKRSLLRRAFDENRGPEMIQKILEIEKRVNDMPEGHAEMLALAEQWSGMAQGVRMLNLLDKKSVYVDEAASAKLDMPGPKTFH
jgi:hypothetical protein